MTYPVQNVAHYILAKMGRLNAMKLEKLVYYCQAWSLAWDDRPLIKENFQARRFGPVCLKIKKLLGDEYVASVDIFPMTGKKAFDEDAIDTMDAIIESYGEFEPTELSQLSHMQKPWIEARGNLPREALGAGRIISQKTMAEFHKSQQ